MAVKEKTSSTRITQFPASKTSHVVTQKESREGNEKTGSRSSKMYRYHDDSIIASNKKGVKKIPANVEHEKELKEASMKTIDIVDALLEKSKAQEDARYSAAIREADSIVRGKKELTDKETKRLKAAKEVELHGVTAHGGREHYFGDPELRRVKSDVMAGIVEQDKQRKRETSASDALTKLRSERAEKSLAKCHSHVLEGETEESVKKKKKQPEKADGHVLGTDPTPRDEGEMVKKKEPDAWKSQQSGERFREEQNRLKQQRLHEKEAYKRTRMTGGTSEWGKYKAEADANKQEMEEKEKSFVSAIDELMIKARVNRLDYDEDGMPQTPEAQKEFDERGRRNAAVHAGIKPKVPKGVKPRKGEEVDKSMITVVDELMAKARVAASKPRSVKLSPEKEKEVLARHEQKLRSLRQSSYRPDYSRYANRMYEEEGGEKSLDERTIDLVKNLENQLDKGGEQAAQAVFNALKDPSLSPKKYGKLTRVAGKASRKYPAYAERLLDKVSAHNERNKSILSTWHKDSSFITKGHVMGPGGEEATLVKKQTRGRTPDYHQTDKKQTDVQSGKLERERKAKQKIELIGDMGAE
jgi:hypothetical protein